MVAHAKIARRLVYAALAIGLSLGALELGLGFYFANYGTKEDRIRYLYSYDELRAAESNFIPLPYVGFGLTPSVNDYNSLGFRGPEIAVPKPAGVFRIVALGSSVTYGNGLYVDDTYPAQLQKILRDDYGYTNVEVINAGVPGYTTWEYLAAFEFRLLALQPDLVIVYESTNDITLRYIDPKFYNSLNMVRGMWNTKPPQLPVSALYRLIALKLDWMTDPNQYNYDDVDFVPITSVSQCWQDKTLDHCPSLDDMSKDDLLAANPPVYYESNLRSLIGIAKTAGVKVLLSTWAYFPDPLPGNEEQYMTYPDRQNAVAEHNEILRKLGDELGVLYYDLEGNIPHNADFWLDGRHMRPAGAHEQASEYAKFLVDQQAIPQP